MGLDATARRRWFGGVVLFASLTMLILGQTVLQGRLGHVGFLVYWLVCFLLTAVAVLVALADARALGQRSRQEHRDLLQTTLRDIESQAQSKPRNGKSPGK